MVPYPARRRRGNRETAAGCILLFDGRQLLVETLRLCQQIWEDRMDIGLPYNWSCGTDQFWARCWITRIMAETPRAFVPIEDSSVMLP